MLFFLPFLLVASFLGTARAREQEFVFFIEDASKACRDFVFVTKNVTFVDETGKELSMDFYEATCHFLRINERTKKYDFSCAFPRNHQYDKPNLDDYKVNFFLVEYKRSPEHCIEPGSEHITVTVERESLFKRGFKSLDCLTIVAFLGSVSMVFIFLIVLMACGCHKCYLWIFSTTQSDETDAPPPSQPSTSCEHPEEPQQSQDPPKQTPTIIYDANLEIITLDG